MPEMTDAATRKVVALQKERRQPVGRFTDASNITDATWAYSNQLIGSSASRRTIRRLSHEVPGSVS